MYEFHGWITLRETFTAQEDEKLALIADSIKSFLTELNWQSGLADLHIINGQYQIAIAGCTNHKGQEASDVLNLYNYVARIAPGSYGLLYILDDENTDGYENMFQVYVLARGKFNKKADPFLSPFIPIVEDHTK